TAFEASDLRPGQRGAVLEILRALPCPFPKLSMVGGQRLNMLRELRGEGGAAERRMAQRTVEMRFRIEMRFHRVGERRRRPEQPLHVQGCLNGRRIVSREKARL